MKSERKFVKNRTFALTFCRLGINFVEYVKLIDNFTHFVRINKKEMEEVVNEKCKKSLIRRNC